MPLLFNHAVNLHILYIARWNVPLNGTVVIIKNALSNKLRNDFKSVCIWRSRNHKCKTNIERFFFAQRPKQAFTSHRNLNRLRRLSVFHTNHIALSKFSIKPIQSLPVDYGCFLNAWFTYLSDQRFLYPRLPPPAIDITDAISNSRQQLMLEFNLYSLHVIEQLIRIHASHHVENVTDMLLEPKLPPNVSMSALIEHRVHLFRDFFFARCGLKKLNVSEPRVSPAPIRRSDLYLFLNLRI